MFRKLLSIGLAINIIMCSIGVLVMHHHCVWCGGDQLELVGHHHDGDGDSDCCGNCGTPGHEEKRNDCCQPELLKLFNGVSADDGFAIKRLVVKPVVFDDLFITPGVQIYFAVFREYGYPAKPPGQAITPPPAFNRPLRC